MRKHYLAFLVLIVLSSLTPHTYSQRKPVHRTTHKIEKPLNLAGLVEPLPSTQIQQKLAVDIDKARGWRFIAVTTRDEAIFYNKDRVVQKSFLTKEAWTRFCSKPKTSAMSPCRLQQVELNCALRRFRLTYEISYRKNGDIFRENGKPSNWVPIIPGTTADEMFQVICEGRPSLDDLMEEMGKDKRPRQ